MDRPFYRNDKIIARILMIMVFLAPIRCIGEVFRIRAYSSEPVMLETVMPFIEGAFITAIACFIMTILSFYSKHKLIIVLGILSIASLVYLKYHFSL